ncbi:hypothetical protein GCM10009565_53030 [Amycolatopsis albidoflavus]
MVQHVIQHLLVLVLQLRFRLVAVGVDVHDRHDCPFALLRRQRAMAQQRERLHHSLVRTAGRQPALYPPPEQQLAAQIHVRARGTDGHVALSRTLQHRRLPRIPFNSRQSRHPLRELRHRLPH